MFSLWGQAGLRIYGPSVGAKVSDLQHVVSDLPDINLALLGREHVYDQDDDLRAPFDADRRGPAILGQINVALC